jgi:hypothetical protein
MLIHDSGGKLVGRVIGQNEIRTTDETLAALWKDQVSHLPHNHKPAAPDTAWMTSVMAVLNKNGYRGDPVE